MRDRKQLVAAYAQALGQTQPAPWYTLARDEVAGGAATLHVYGVIGWDVEAGALVAELDALDPTVALDVFVNSPGGLLFDGVAIFNALNRRPAPVNVTVDGLAASAASLIAMAGDQIVMGTGAQMMIHDAAILAIGNPAELRDMADWLDQQSDNAASIYAARAGGSRDEWRARMTAETWYTADQAVAAGLATATTTPNGSSSSGSDSGNSSSSSTTNTTDWAGRLVALATAPRCSDPARPNNAATSSATTTTHQENRMDLDELTGQITDLGRRLDLINHNGAGRTTGPKASAFNTAGAMLKAIAAGDPAAVAEYTETMNAYSGGTTADDGTLAPAWIGDLTQIIAEGSGLASWFDSAPLPAEGMSLEYGRLKDNTVTVGKQAAEGDPLPFGKVTVDSATAPVETFGGYTELTVQEVKRTRINLLDLALKALAVAAGRNRNARFRTAFDAAVTAQTTSTHLVLDPATATWADWLDALVDADDIYADLGLSMDALILKTADFKALMHLKDSTGRPYLDLDGSGTNNVGTIDLGGTPLAGRLGKLPVLKSAKTTAVPTFANRHAIVSYVSPLASLSDQDIVQLSQAYSVYYFGSTAVEMPAGLVPLTSA